MKQSDLYLMSSKAAALNATIGTTHDIWGNDMLFIPAINHGHVSPNTNDRNNPVWINPSGNSITYPLTADRSR